MLGAVASAGRFRPLTIPPPYRSRLQVLYDFGELLLCDLADADPFFFRTPTSRHHHRRVDVGTVRGGIPAADRLGCRRL